MQPTATDTGSVPTSQDDRDLANMISSLNGTGPTAAVPPAVDVAPQTPPPAGEAPQAVADPALAPAQSPPPPAAFPEPTPGLAPLSGEEAAVPVEVTPAPAEPPAPTEALAAAPPLDLESMENDVISRLQPLIEYIPADEKFDAQLRILRATDDKNLLVEAKKTAEQIKDPTRQAEALTEILKEIDFFKKAA